MSNTIATYSFLPWLRQGIANQLQAAEMEKKRAFINVALKLEGPKLGNSSELISQDIQPKKVEMFGPGDVVGIDSRAIFRTEPRNWITNFEPNFLPFVELYDEDFAWRYTPAPPPPPDSVPEFKKHRLLPWIALVVLEEGAEFSEGQNIKDKPLPFIEVPDAGTVFPPADQLWAWAHVQVNRSLAASDDEIVSDNMNEVLPKLRAALSDTRDIAYSRIICPRILKENTPYHAFLVPVFESGRLAGLGLDPIKAPNATFSAWASYPDGSVTRDEPTRYPYYFRWYFRTGTIGDFEYLVRLLQPKPVDNRVGTRDMDVQKPNPNLPGILNLDGVLRLGGALRVPVGPQNQEEFNKYDNWAQPYPHSFQKALAAFINLADEYADKPVKKAHDESSLDFEIVDDGNEDDPDPIITPPLYGRWHALTQRLLTERGGDPAQNNENWVHELNLDPRYRVAAGFGTKVVQERQEEFMNAAWNQLDKVLEANKTIRIAQLATAVSFVWHAKHLEPLRAVNFERAMAITAPINRRVLVRDVESLGVNAPAVTVHHQLGLSRVVPATVSTQMRQMTRPGGRLMQSLPFGPDVQSGNLLSLINAGQVSAAPPKKTPPGVVTIKDVANALVPEDAPTSFVELLRRFPEIRQRIYPCLQDVPFRRWLERIRQASSIREENQTPQAVDQLPRSPDFVLSDPASGFNPHQGAIDSVEAVRFKAGVKDLHRILVASASASFRPPKVTLDLPSISTATFQAINPEVTIARRIFQTVSLPARVKAAVGDGLVEAMAYPEFDTPMYEPLKDISSELFLPNLNLVEQNSITLLETNQKFIEAYMVGLNHEFARELLWREYPTDQRGSYFRQFWDAVTFLDTENLSAEQLKEKLRDILPLHRWERSSNLGKHDNREKGGEEKENVIVVIRGELLKKYPTAVIYAHKAKWARKKTDPTEIDYTLPREIDDLGAADAANPPDTKVRMPLYQAKIEPDVYFFGFDLDIEEARGGTGDASGDESRPGWFIVIKERPGEPRFGLDLKRDGELNLWNDLSQNDVPKDDTGNFIQAGTTTSLMLKEPPQPTGDDDQDGKDRQAQYKEDIHVHWNDASSADLAYILFQVPVLIAVHASEMLPKRERG